MAGVSPSLNVLNALKVVQKDGIESLLFRNDPVLRTTKVSRTEGKELRFAAMFGRGGACGGDYTIVKQNAVETARNAEWKTIPGKIFSALTVNQIELLASRTKKGFYQTILGNKIFAALEAERKQLAKALYGTGYGEFDVAKESNTLTVGQNTITLTEDGVIGIDVGTQFRFIKPSATDGSLGASATVGLSINTVTAINGLSVTFTATSADTYEIGDVLCFEGSRDPNGYPLLPVGLEGWIPTVGNRTGTIWNTYINNPFYGVTRGQAVDRLAGHFVLSPAAGYSIADQITELFRRCRNGGAVEPMIVINDRKFAELMSELNTKQNLWQTTTGTDKGDKTEAVIGFNKISAAFSTSWLNRMIDTPYCPYNKVYLLEREDLEFVNYGMADEVINDGVTDNEPGKTDPNAQDEFGLGDVISTLNHKDLITVEPGVATQDGPASCISFNIYGTFILFNTSKSGVCILQ